MEIDKLFSDQSDKIRGVVSVPLSMISTCKNTRCLSSRAINLSLVIDSGASVCIYPHKGDFILYDKSNMKIKDFSSSNNVAGEGILYWNLKDVHGSTIQVELKGYHMPNAEVRLLSPQVLINTVGGCSLQTKKGVELTLDNGVNLFAQYCPHSNLPLLPLADPSEDICCFWSQAFGFTTSEFRKINAIKLALLK
jgi:hypothetical protein